MINLSLGALRRAQLIQDLFDEMHCRTDADVASVAAGGCVDTNDVVVVAAAGNGGDSVPQYPAAEQVEGLLAVGASTVDDTRADFSTYGPWVRLAAPGELIISTVPGGGYGTWSGTSMAAPFAAGTAALVRAVRQGLNAAAVVDRVVSTASTICGAIPKRLDVAAALDAAAAIESCAAQYRVLLPLTRS